MGRPFAPHIITPDSALGGRDIGKSLRFNASDSAYLRYLPGSAAASSTTFTFSAWVKRTLIGSTECIAGSHSGSNAFNIFGIDSNDRLMWRSRNSSSSDLTRIQSSVRLRDTNSWYHLLLERNTTLSTAADRAKLYINGVRVTDFTNNVTDSQNYTYTSDFLTDINIGRYQVNSSTVTYSYMYLAEYHYVDGQALDPSYFAFTEPQTGIWRPKKYEGTHGQNGFYLDFSDNSAATATTIGKDRSGNGNDVTPNNISVSAGEGNDSMLDSPTNNFCTLNTLTKNMGAGSNATVLNGNLDYLGTGGNDNMATTHAVRAGKWYYEATLKNNPQNLVLGWTTVLETTNYTETALLYYNSAGIKGGNATMQWDTNVTTSLSFSTDDIIGFALDLTSNELKVYKNNSLVSTITLPTDKGDTWIPCCGDSSGTDGSAVLNFGQRAFSYTPPTGFRSLCDKNMTTPTGTSVVNPKRHFDSILYAGNSSTQTVTGLQFQPDFAWIKNRSDGHHSSLTDSVRGMLKTLSTSRTDIGEYSESAGLNSFLSNGLGFNGNNYFSVNIASKNFVAWCWKAGGATVTNNDGNLTSQVSVNKEAGFSIAKYTGSTSSGALTVGHGLGKKPAMVIIRRTDDGADWIIGHKGLATNAFANNKFLKFDTGTTGTNSLVFGAEPTTTVTQITSNGAGGATNLTSSGTYVMYSWAEIPGFSKMDVYKGNGIADGTFVHLGFRPAWIMLKRIDNTSGANWLILDNKRNPTNIVNRNLYANASNDDGTTDRCDFLSKGFKIKQNGTTINADGGTYIYMAIAEQPGLTPYMASTNAR